MATDVHQEVEQFVFSSRTVKVGDEIHIEEERGHVVIMVADVTPTCVVGMATNKTGDWSGPYGQIIFREPIQLGRPTSAIFNTGGDFPKHLEAVPTRVVLRRDGEFQGLLGC